MVGISTGFLVYVGNKAVQEARRIWRMSPPSPPRPKKKSTLSQKRTLYPYI
jgi:hypothetical protein